MSTAQVGATTNTIHMHVTYFTGEAAAVELRDVVSALRQLELLVQYAALVTDDGHEAAKRAFAKAAEGIRSRLKDLDPATSEAMSEFITEAMPASRVADITAAELTRAQTFGLVRVELEQVSVLTIQMSSPLTAVLEISPTLWPGIGFGLLLLVERIATAPARIARKQKEELLKRAVVDEKIKLVQSGRADVLGALLRQAGPGDKGPDEVVFRNPDDPQDELEPASLAR